jgi:hypothetical protein
MSQLLGAETTDTESADTGAHLYIGLRLFIVIVCIIFVI